MTGELGQIPEAELWSLYKNTCHTRQVSFAEFKANYMNTTLIKVEAEELEKRSGNKEIVALAQLIQRLCDQIEYHQEDTSRRFRFLSTPSTFNP